jgi:aryl-alcohol dehydrogenase-like predicted oxidoreductase
MAPEKRKLGRTGIEITPIGLGVWQFSEGRGGATGTWSTLTTETHNDIVKRALDEGINWFDTAEMYGFGRSERNLSRGLQAAGVAVDDVVIATKWMPFLRTARSIKKTIGNRQSALAPYNIDLHQIHLPVSFSSIRSQMDAMADLVEAGKIRSVGVSNFSAGMMRRAHECLANRGLPLASNQVEYSLTNRRIESNGILETAKELGITIIAYSPLGMGLLTGKFHKDPDMLGELPFRRRLILRRSVEETRPLVKGLEEIAGAHSVSISQVALNWLVNFHGDIVVAIPGASKARHAVESARAMLFTLRDDEMARIDELSRKYA